MKKVLMIISILLAGLLVTGCVSIPLGDAGTLEISKDGVNVAPGDEEELDANPDVKEIIEEDEPVEEDPVSENDVTSEENAIEDDEIDKEDAPEKDEKKSEVVADTTSCDELIEDGKGNDRLVKALAKLAPPSFPLSECTLMGVTKESYSNTYKATVIESDFKVEGYWADVYDLYVEYMEETGFSPLAKSEDAKDQSARVSGKTVDYDLSLHFKQRNADDDTELVEITFVLYH